MNTIVVDIGNSSIKSASVIDGIIVNRKHVDLVALESESMSVDGPDWDALLGSPTNDDFDSTIVGVSSVVPSVSASLNKFAEANGLRILSISTSMRLPFEVAYKSISTLGTDRLAGAVAAYHRFHQVGRHLIVVDAGTAVNYEVVTKDGIYRGGPIAPGLRAMRDALVRRAAQLPDVPMSIPRLVVGDSTTSALQSGIVYSFVDAVAGMIARISTSIGDGAPKAGKDPDEVFVVLTGGDATFLSQAGVAANRIEPNLVLLGIADLAQAANS